MRLVAARQSVPTQLPCRDRVRPPEAETRRATRACAISPLEVAFFREVKANETSIGDLFQRDVRFVAPLYQRPYVWTHEKNWVPMWDAIRLVADRQSHARSTDGQARPYFLGAIVLEPMNLPTARVTSWQLIDGQQRLTTLQVALASWSDLCRERGFDDVAALYKELTRNRLLSTQNTEEEFKVWPTNRDRPTYSAVVRGEDISAVPSEGQNRLLLDAAEFFRRQLRDWLGENPSDDRRSLEDMLTALKRFLVLVEIRLEPDDDPQQIFETLNSLGTPLLNADLVKNLLFRGMSDRDTAQLYEQTWRPFEDKALFWRDRVRQGRLLTPRIDLFLQHYLVANLVRDVTATELFAEYRRYFGVSAKTPRQELHDLSAYAQIFERIEKLPRREPTSKLGAALRRLHRLDTTTVYPLLLEIFRRMSEADTIEAVGTIESYLVRRAVCRLTSKNYNRLFVQILRDLGDTWTVQGLRELLLAFRDDTSRWPSDDEFVASWTTVEAYRTLRSGRLLAIFEALEREARTLQNEEIVVEGDLAIEHLLPQGWTEDDWPLPDDLAPNEATARRKKLLNNFGNLRVLTSKLNTKQSNHRWSLKRPVLLKHSVSVLNNALPVDWTDLSIQSRSADLAELAKRAWPRPATPTDIEWRSGQSEPASEDDGDEDEGRGATYQQFFERVFAEFRSVRPDAATSAGSRGWSWFTFPSAGTAGTHSRYGWSFATGKRLRCELYLDSGTKAAVKKNFDRLVLKRSEIEDAYGTELSWERLDTGRASRIADYRGGNVYDEPGVTDDLVDWAVLAMASLYDALDHQLTNRGGQA